MQQKKNLWQNTACLEQPIYASQENFTLQLAGIGWNKIE